MIDLYKCSAASPLVLMVDTDLGSLMPSSVIALATPPWEVL